MAKPIEELTFTDDFVFGRIMHNPEICKGLLERLLAIKTERKKFTKHNQCRKSDFVVVNY